MKKLCLSIVIVSWNAKSFLLKCLQSIYNARISCPFEVIVVDNHSCDGSPESVQKEFPNVRLIKNHKNFGFAKANNIGIRESSGEYVCLVNSDVEILEACFDELMGFMENNPAVGMVGPKVLNCDMTLQSSCRKFPSLWNNFCEAFRLNQLFPESSFFSGEHMFFFAHDRVMPVNILVGCFLMVRRKAMETVGLLDERFFIYAEDIDWSQRFWEKGWQVVFFPGARTVHFRGGSSSNSPRKFSAEQLKARFQYWEKYRGKFGVLSLSAVLSIHYLNRIGSTFLMHMFAPVKRTEINSRRDGYTKSLKAILPLTFKFIKNGKRDSEPAHSQIK